MKLFHSKAGARLVYPILIFSLLASACSFPRSLPVNGPVSTSLTSSTAVFTPTPLPTSTPIPTPTPVPAARVDAGERALFNGDWDQALTEFQTALENSTDPEVKSAALLGIGRTHYQSGDTKGAIDALNNVIQNYSKSASVPYAYFFLGEAYNDLERYAQAADAYQRYLDRRPGIIDAYVYEKRGDALAAAGNNTPAINDYRTALQYPSFLDTFQIEIKAANVVATAGDYETALALYTDLYNRADNDYTKAELDLLIGRVDTALGKAQEAYAAYLDAVNNYPTAYDSYQALLALVDAGVPVDELNRGIVDYYAGQYGVALAAFDRYLQSAPADPATGRYYNGLTLRELGSYQKAIGEWDIIIQQYSDSRFWDDAWEQKGYTQWAYMDQYGPAVQTLLGFVTAAPDHVRAGEFLFDAAQVAERDNQLEKAAELWERDFTQYPNYELALRALFLAGISRFRLRDYAGAFNTFSSLANSAAKLEDRAAAYLWQGKAKDAMGDKTAAQAAWELASNTDPTGYYSERARDLLRGRSPFSPPQAYDLARDVASEKAQAEAWIRTTFNLSADVDLSSLGPLQNDSSFQRGAELWKLGLYDQARQEFEYLRTSVENDPAQTYRLANYLIDLGMYRSGILAARQVLTLAGMDDAATMNAPDYFNHLRFGAYFSDLIMPQAQANGFNPLFLFSVVRQESAFEGFVRSSAGARGLMQIIPATGQEVAASIGWPQGYSDSDLYRPVVSVTLGVSYLAKLRDRLDGDMYAALAAYNSGPGNASKWQELAKGDPDLFLEIIRYDETRNYIRGIYEIFTIYRRLYDRSP